MQSCPCLSVCFCHSCININPVGFSPWLFFLISLSSSFDLKSSWFLLSQKKTQAPLFYFENKLLYIKHVYFFFVFCSRHSSIHLVTRNGQTVDKMKRYSFARDIFSSLKVKKHSLSIITILSPSAHRLLSSLHYHQRIIGFVLPTVCTLYLRNITIPSSDLDGLFKMTHKLTPFLVWKLSVNSLVSLYFCLFINSLLVNVFNFCGFFLTVLKNRIWLIFVGDVYKMP